MVLIHSVKSWLQCSMVATRGSSALSKLCARVCMCVFLSVWLYVSKTPLRNGAGRKRNARFIAEGCILFSMYATIVLI